MPIKHVVLPGGSGFPGRSLTRRLAARGDRVTIVTRGPSGLGEGCEFVHWDGRLLIHRRPQREQTGSSVRPQLLGESFPTSSFAAAGRMPARWVR